MKSLYSYIIFVSLLLVSANLRAEAPSFSYVGAEYVASGSFKASSGSLSADLDSNGFAVNGSLELGVFFIQASRLELDNDEVLGIESDSSFTSAAIGLTFELPQTQVYGLVRAQQAEQSARELISLIVSRLTLISVNRVQMLVLALA